MLTPIVERVAGYFGAGEFFSPDGTPQSESYERTTHAAVVCHPDDGEILGIPGILECYRDPDHHFLNIVVTDGAGSPRTGLYADTSDLQMTKYRKREQRAAATIGEYAVSMLNYPSSYVKDPEHKEEVVDTLREHFLSARPDVVYTHNLADKHPTHVAVAVRTIQALRAAASEGYKPEELYGMEVWRDLDWFDEAVDFDVSERPNLQQALLGVFDSQIGGGKAYDEAVMGRRRANATFSQSHGVDEAIHTLKGMDLMPLLDNPAILPEVFIAGKINDFREDVNSVVEEFTH